MGFNRNAAPKCKTGTFQKIRNDFTRNKWSYALALPGMLFYIIFAYVPIYGIIIAFKDYNAAGGILGSPWVGLKHFSSFFGSIYFKRLLTNTVMLNFYGILFGFPLPIILALMLNEVRNAGLKKTVQTMSYLPHFISMVVICGMIVDFTSFRGIITQALNAAGGNYTNLLNEPKLYRTIYIVSDIWQGLGWNSIIYIAALSGVDAQLYEAAEIDGAGKWRQTLSVTIPGIMPTVVIMFVLRVGSIMSLGADKTILLYNPAIYEKADIISSYVYRKGLLENNQSLSTAVGLFNSLINCAMVLGANTLSKKLTDSGLF